MDELYILGCLLLVFALVVAPVLAVIGFNRSTAARQEIARLRQRIEALEQRGVPLRYAPETAQTAAPADVTAPVVDARARTCRPLASGESAVPGERARFRPARAAKQPSAFGGMLTSLVRWFMQGNPLAKLGILLLFLGLSFLLRYTVEHSLFPLELRLAATALFAIVCWRSGGDCGTDSASMRLSLQGGRDRHSLPDGLRCLPALANVADDAGLCIAGGRFARRASGWPCCRRR